MLCDRYSIFPCIRKYSENFSDRQDFNHSLTIKTNKRKPPQGPHAIGHEL